MRIFRALGLGLAIIILQFLMRDVFSAFEVTLLQFFEFTQAILEVGGSNVASPFFQVD